MTGSAPWSIGCCRVWSASSWPARSRPTGRTVTLDALRADVGTPRPRRALLSVSDKSGLVDLGRGLVARGFELVSTGGTARTLRDDGLPVTDVAAVTGSPEMLDGRVKTLHPRIHGGLLADRRLDEHRLQLIEAGIAPFELVVVNLYPFAAALERPGITVDELIEEIDIGGPSMVRAAAKNHANVAIVTAPARYGAILDALDRPDGLDERLRRELAIEAFAHTAAYDARIASELPGRMVEAGLLDAVDDPYPATLTLALEKVDSLRYGENPHQPAARYRRPGSTLADGLFGVERSPLQGKALSYNNVLDAAAAAALGRALRGPAVVIVKHMNPCGAAERGSLLDAWTAALEADPVSAFGGVVALTREVDGDVARALTSIFLEIVIAPGFTPEALEVLAAKPNLRVLLDEALADDAPVPPTAVSPTGSVRTAGARCSSRRRTSSATTQRPGPSPRRAPRPATSTATSTSPGGWSVGSRRTPSSSSATADSSGSGAARQAGSTLPARPSPRPRPSWVPRAPAVPPARATPFTHSPTRSRRPSRPGSAHTSSPAARCATPRRSPSSMPPMAPCSSPGSAISATDRPARSRGG